MIALAAASVAAAARQRIDLVEFGRVVQLPDEPKRVTTDEDELTRGADGWEAPKNDNGEYSIGIEWDEPRDIAEVTIEFRHAIANREQIRVQYWKAEPAGAGTGAPRGRWFTPRWDWWAGDRDVSFAFMPEDREAGGHKPEAGRFRRTTRIRFLCGKDELPPVRYLKAYGADPVTTDTFDFRFERARMAPPVMITVVNGYILAVDSKTTMTSAVLQESPGALEVRYARTDPASPNATRLMLAALDHPKEQQVLRPAQAARDGRIRLDEAGVVMERRGGRPASAPVPADASPAERRK
jgi:hypothetical protein